MCTAMLHPLLLLRFAVVLLVTAPLLLGACSDTSSGVAPVPTLGAVVLAPDDTVVVSGRSVPLRLEVRDVGGRILPPSAYAVAFAAAPADAATVDPNGVVRTTGFGTITVTATVRVGAQQRTATATIRAGVIIGRWSAGEPAP